MEKKVTIIDYGMGNLWSVGSAFRYLGCSTIITDNPIEIEKAETLILPGVGSFRKAMISLRQKKIDQAIFEAVMGKGNKLLGICLGMQLLANSGTEDGFTEGLGFIQTNVERFKSAKLNQLKIPHIGFNNVYGDDQSVLFKGLCSPADFYFVHSYRLLPSGVPGLHGIAKYGEEILVAYENGNVFGTQFHPEKSQTNGLKLLNNFLSH